MALPRADIFSFAVRFYDGSVTAGSSALTTRDLSAFYLLIPQGRRTSRRQRTWSTYTDDSVLLIYMRILKYRAVAY